MLDRTLGYLATGDGAGQPGYYEELDAVRDGTARTAPAEETIPDWQERSAAARAQRQ